MFGKKTSASADYIMARAKSVGNIKENRKGGTTYVNHDKKTGMKKGSPTAKPPMKEGAASKGVNPVKRVESRRQKIGAAGTVEVD